MVDRYRVMISNKQKNIKIPVGIRMLMRRCCNAVLKHEKFKGSAEVSIILCDNEYIKQLNKKFRGKDTPTDVLSFPMSKENDVDPVTGVKILGDIVISVEKVLEQMESYGHTMQREFAYLTAHGMLHILGYDHEKSAIDKIRMREKEEHIMDLLGVPHTVSYAIDSNV